MIKTDRPDLPYPTLCLVTDGGRHPKSDTVAVVAAASAGGVNMVQLRDKSMPASELLALGRKLRKITANRALLFVNDRVDVALACGADGVQLGELGLPVPMARSVAGSGLLIGRSVHDPGGAAAAEAEGADLLIVGTVFPSESHPGGLTGGLQMVEAVAEAVDLPFLAIGGVTSKNIRSVMDYGASGAAVIRAVWQEPDPEAAARALWSKMAGTAADLHRESER